MKLCLVEIEDQVQFANVAKISIEDFDEKVNNFQCIQLVVFRVNANDEIQTCIAEDTTNLSYQACWMRNRRNIPLVDNL
jgi:hypothetical protein